MTPKEAAKLEIYDLVIAALEKQLEKHRFERRILKQRIYQRDIYRKRSKDAHSHLGDPVSR